MAPSRSWPAAPESSSAGSWPSSSRLPDPPARASAGWRLVHLAHHRKEMRMETKDHYDEFLEAVDALRKGDVVVRTTAHTSSVAADGWPAKPTDGQEAG